MARRAEMRASSSHISLRCIMPKLLARATSLSYLLIFGLVEWVEGFEKAPFSAASLFWRVAAGATLAAATGAGADLGALTQTSWERWKGERNMNMLSYQGDIWWLMMRSAIYIIPHLPAARWGLLVRFYQSCSPPPPPPPLPPPPPHPPPPPRSPDPSGHSRTSTASSRSQWAQPDLHRGLQIPVALPGLNRDFQIAVGTAGLQPRLPDRSGHCRTSTATSRSQWALPDLNGKNVRKDVR